MDVSTHLETLSEHIVMVSVIYSVGDSLYGTTAYPHDMDKKY